MPRWPPGRCRQLLRRGVVRERGGELLEEERVPLRRCTSSLHRGGFGRREREPRSARVASTAVSGSSGSFVGPSCPRPRSGGSRRTPAARAPGTDGWSATRRPGSRGGPSARRRPNGCPRTPAAAARARRGAPRIAGPRSAGGSRRCRFVQTRPSSSPGSARLRRPPPPGKTMPTSVGELAAGDLDRVVLEDAAARRTISAERRGTASAPRRGGFGPRARGRPAPRPSARPPAPSRDLPIPAGPRTVTRCGARVPRTRSQRCDQQQLPVAPDERCGGHRPAGGDDRGLVHQPGGDRVALALRVDRRELRSRTRGASADGSRLDHDPSGGRHRLQPGRDVHDVARGERVRRVRRHRDHRLAGADGGAHSGPALGGVRSAPGSPPAC